MSYKIASPLASYTVDELVSSKAGPQGTAAYDEMVYDPVAQDRLSAEFSLSLEVSAEITTVILVDLSGSTGQGIGQEWPSGESYSMADLFYEEVKALVRALPNRDVVILGYGSHNGDGWLGEEHGRYTRRLSLDRDESWSSMGGTIPISSELIQAIHTKLGGYGTFAHTPIQIINISDGLPMDYLPLNLFLSAETFNAEGKKLGIIMKIDRDDKTAEVLGVFSSYDEGKKAMTYLFKEALKERAEEYEEDLMSFTQGKKEYDWYESRSKKKKHLDFYHPTGYDDVIVLKEHGIVTLADFEETFGAETFNADEVAYAVMWEGKEDDNDGLIYGIEYMDGEEVSDVEWFATAQERDAELKSYIEEFGEDFGAEECKGTTQSGHEVEWDDGSIYIEFAEPIRNWKTDSVNEGRGYTSVTGDWYGGDNESPDKFSLTVTNPDADYADFTIDINDVEYYGVSQNKHNRWQIDGDYRGNAPDIFVDMSDDLVAAIEEGLNWMVGDFEEYNAEEFGAEGERKGYEVVWMHEPDEENWDGQFGGAMESPRPVFSHYKEAVQYCDKEKLKSRAIILEYGKGAIQDGEWDVVNDKKWGSWNAEEFGAETPYQNIGELQNDFDGLMDSYNELFGFIKEFSEMGNDYVTEKGKEYIENHMRIFHAEEFGAQTEAKRALKLLRRKSSKQRTQNRKQARKVKEDKYGSEERAETDSSKGFIADAKYGAGATFGVIGALFTGGFLMSLLGRRS